MIIIKEEDTVITHFGVRGMRWGPNLLDKKISEFHTTHDDGYLSVLERIKK